jgi:polyhydroxyalkanoate synthesis repressor PhaR
VAKRANVKEPAKPKRRGRPPRRETVTPDLPGVRVIKRYGNRRLYDHTLSRAVTMDDLAAAVRRGEDFRVFDGESGNDVTRRALLQIVLEEQNEMQLNLLPIDFLRLLIQLRSEPTGQWMSQYLDAGAEWLTRHLTQAAAQGAPALRNLQESLETMFPWMRSEARGGDSRREASHARREPSQAAASTGAAAAKGNGDIADEIHNLQTRLADLAKRVIRR